LYNGSHEKQEWSSGRVKQSGQQTGINGNWHAVWRRLKTSQQMRSWKLKKRFVEQFFAKEYRPMIEQWAASSTA
jgi:hypothetical protein